jgi:2-methylaconitate cis-trans-isomerase PrpF
MSIATTSEHAEFYLEYVFQQKCVVGRRFDLTGFCGNLGAA